MKNNSPHITPELCSLILSGISEGVFAMDFKGNFLLVNEAFLTTFGYSREELVGKSYEVIFPEKASAELFNDYILTAAKTEPDKKLVAFKSSGTRITIKIKVILVKNAESTPEYFIGIVSDLTEEIKNKEAIDDAQGKYDILFRELKDAVYESTPEGKMTDLNPSGMQLFGFESREEMLNCNIAEDLYANEEERKKFKKLLERDGYVKNFEVEIKRKYGINAVVYETSVGVKDKDGKIKAYRGILRDVTQVKKQELQLREFVEKLAMLNEQLRESEAELKRLNASKDKFFSIIAHDLRSPFSSLLGFSEFLEQDINDLTPEEISVFAGKINESARNVFSLLENLLQWSRIQTGRMSFEPVYFNMANRITQCMSILSDNAYNKGIELLCAVDTEVMVFADENMVTSVVQNLMSNAIKFTKSGGAITVSSKDAGDFVEITVKDTGIGMNEEDVAKLFKIDVHHTTVGTNDEKGTGLGLILCNELINKNGGKMWVESRFGEGSKFFFTLPKFQKH